MGYLAPPPAPAPVVVVRDIGGLVADYRQQTEIYRRQGREVRLHECRSACTLALSLPNVCVYKSSLLRFHQAYNRDTKQVDFGVSDELFRSYPPAVRARLGYLTRKYKTLTGAELIRLGVRDCNAPKGREPQIMVARAGRQKAPQPGVRAPGDGPVAKFLTRVAGSLFGDRQPDGATAPNPTSRTAKASARPVNPLQTAVRVAGLPAVVPLPPSRPAGLTGQPSDDVAPQEMKLPPPRDLLAEARKPVRPASRQATIVRVELPKLITGAYPVLPPRFLSYAPMR